MACAAICPRILPQMLVRIEYKGKTVMCKKPFRLEIFLCQVSMIIVLMCILGCSIFLALNIYTIYVGDLGNDAAAAGLRLNTQTKSIELCQPNVLVCANLRWIRRLLSANITKLISVATCSAWVLSTRWIVSTDVSFFYCLFLTGSADFIFFIFYFFLKFSKKIFPGAE